MEINNLEDFAEFIKAYRHDNRLSQIQLEEKTNVPQPRISQIEKGVKVGFENYRRIISGLGLTLTLSEKLKQ